MAPASTSTPEARGRLGDSPAWGGSQAPPQCEHVTPLTKQSGCCRAGGGSQQAGFERAGQARRRGGAPSYPSRDAGSCRACLRSFQRADRGSGSTGTSGCSIEGVWTMAHSRCRCRAGPATQLRTRPRREGHAVRHSRPCMRPGTPSPLVVLLLLPAGPAHPPPAGGPLLLLMPQAPLAPAALPARPVQPRAVVHSVPGEPCDGKVRRAGRGAAPAVIVPGPWGKAGLPGVRIVTSGASTLLLPLVICLLMTLGQVRPHGSWGCGRGGWLPDVTAIGGCSRKGSRSHCSRKGIRSHCTRRGRWRQR